MGYLSIYQYGLEVQGAPFLILFSPLSNQNKIVNKIILLCLKVALMGIKTRKDYSQVSTTS